MSDAIDAELVRKLIAEARAARANAYAPFSRFRVGAAVLDEHGAIHRGCNVENASYGLTVCAERHALAAAVVTGARKVHAVAVVSVGEPLATPCGACRQVLAQFATDDVPVYVADGEGSSGPVEVLTMGQLLPRAFRFVPDAT